MVVLVRVTLGVSYLLDRCRREEGATDPNVFEVAASIMVY